MRLRPLNREDSRGASKDTVKESSLSHSGASRRDTLLMCLGRTRLTLPPGVPGADQSSTWFRVLLGESWT